MKIHPIIHNNEAKFGNKYKLNEKTIKLVEQSTKLSYEKMKSLPLDETTKPTKKHIPFWENIKQKCRNIKKV